MSEIRTVAILGGGIMANAVASTLQQHGLELRRYNRTPSAIVGPSTICSTPAEAAQGADAVWSFVHNDQASRAVWFGVDGALGAVDGAMVIESSTLSPPYAEKWMNAVQTSGGRAVLLPVTGSRPAAEHGTLVGFIAGSDDDIAAVEPLTGVVTTELLRVDSAAEAATVKLLNNTLAAVILAGLAETLTAAAELGVDRARLVELWSRHGWASSVTAKYGQAMLDGEHSLTDCSLGVIAKDLRYALNTLGTDAPLIAITAGQFAQAVHDGLGDQEMSAIARTR
jgi:3-hydroxyisobutyrate dehydrogenase